MRRVVVRCAFTASKSESPTSTNRSRGHRSVDVGDSDFCAFFGGSWSEAFVGALGYPCLRVVEFQRHVLFWLVFCQTGVV
ncbi:MAG: hypothetical protein K2H04_07230 [Bacteroidaceae bacterium]|nr:hypothetical protein [Bacteroidaceae bacterium]MDE7117984.1 hypothetical protein [Bacteroidaceae bacterium]